MKTRSLLFMAALVACLAGGGALLAPRPTRTSCKPSAPIELEASLIGDPISPFGVHAKANSLIGDEVELEIIVPDGVIHLGGERKARGKKVETRVDLRAQDRTPRQIVVRASISDGTGRVSKFISLKIFGSPPEQKGTLKVDNRGDLILEGSP
jgi:hypothetical protein